MCRLLSVITRKPATLSDAVGGTLHEFSKLSDLHKDSWGFAWREPDEALNLHTRVEAAWTSAAYRSRLETVLTSQGLVHLRKASEGMALIPENCHPFTEGPIAFAHNGHFEPGLALRDHVARNGGRVCRGTTDSELFFALLLLHARTLDWPDAIAATARQIVDDYRAHRGDDLPEALNCVVMTPDATYAYSQHDPRKVRAGESTDVYTLQLRRTIDDVVIGSSGWALSGAETIPPCRVVEVDRATLGVRVHEPVEFESEELAAA